MSVMFALGPKVERWAIQCANWRWEGRTLEEDE